MGLLDGLLGGGQQGGSPLESLVLTALSNQGGGLGSLAGLLGGGATGGGGLQGLVSAFEQQGLGHIAQSWIGDGPNHPVAPEQVQAVFGNEQIQSMANQTGMPQEDVLSELARLLPGVVDRLTQGGQTPGTTTSV
jgi:uncharacterized protein YidB (DUF937 family)